MGSSDLVISSIILSVGLILATAMTLLLVYELPHPTQSRQAVLVHGNQNDVSLVSLLGQKNTVDINFTLPFMGTITNVNLTVGNASALGPLGAFTSNVQVTNEQLTTDLIFPSWPSSSPLNRLVDTTNVSALSLMNLPSEIVGAASDGTQVRVYYSEDGWYGNVWTSETLVDVGETISSTCLLSTINSNLLFFTNASTTGGRYSESTSFDHSILGLETTNQSEIVAASSNQGILLVSVSGSTISSQLSTSYGRDFQSPLTVATDYSSSLSLVSYNGSFLLAYIDTNDDIHLRQFSSTWVDLGTLETASSVSVFVVDNQLAVASISGSTVQYAVGSDDLTFDPLATAFTSTGTLSHVELTSSYGKPEIIFQENESLYYTIQQNGSFITPIRIGSGTSYAISKDHGIGLLSKQTNILYNYLPTSVTLDWIVQGPL